MPRRLVVCCDGTWNTPDQRSHGTASPTNITKLALNVAPRGPDGVEQRVFYDRGVGTGRRDHLFGGVFGAGLSHHVLDAYRFLAEEYEVGDQLYFLGFSRGAFTARSAAGLVRNCGILRRRHRDRLEDAYRLYRSRRDPTKPDGFEAQLFRRTFSHDTRIRFLGVFDTVGALGIPAGALGLSRLVDRRWQFHDTRLSSTVDAAFHALAVHERRGPFQPTLWEPTGAPGQRLEQVWFTGVHSDVGGGYPEPELSEIALLWMVARARQCSLAFRDGAFSTLLPDGCPPGSRAAGLCTDPRALGRLHESRTRFYRLLPPAPRRFGSTGDNEKVATSVSYRYPPPLRAGDLPETFHPAVAPGGGALREEVDYVAEE